MSIQAFDLILVLCICVSAFFAFRRGFVAETLAIIGWVVAFFAALYIGPWLAGRIDISPHWFGLALAYIIVFVVALLVMSFLSHQFSKNIKSSCAGPADRALGLVFGVVRALVVFAVLFLFFFSMLGLKQPHWLTDARTYPVVRRSAEMLVSLVPDHTFDALSHEKKKTSQLRQKNTLRADAEPQERVPVARVGIRKSNQNHEKMALNVVPEVRPATSKTAKKPTDDAKHSKTAYGAADRKALDRLIEASGAKEKR